MTDMITRCPSCATSFRITESQLQTAKGAVRCGSCLHIFKALDHLIQPKGQSPKKATQPKPADPAKPTAGKSETPKAADSSELTTKFEYRRPAPVPEPDTTIPPDIHPEKATRDQDETPAAIEPPEKPVTEPQVEEEDTSLPSIVVESDYDELNLDTNNISEELGQENMLAFDQNAIDHGDVAEGDEEDLLISDDMPLDDDEEEPQKFSGQAYGDDLSESFLDLDTDSWKPKETSLFDRKSKPQKDEDEERKDSDESWAINLLEEMEEDDGDSDELLIQPPAPDSREDDRVDNEYNPSTTGTFTALDDDDLEEVLGAHLSEPIDEDDEDVFVYKDRLDSGEHKAFADDQEYEASEDDDLEDDDYEDTEDYYSEPDDRAALLRGIEPEPLEMESEGHIHWRKNLIYAATVTTGLLLLLIQVAWLQFDNLSHKPPYRGWYAAICPVIGCELPNLRATNQIRAYNLVVRSHPETSNALMVDTILLNTATFQQPFPDLVLSFSNIQGDVLAARTFSPKEYLAGELAGKSQMPSGQPVHLSLEIVDPGPDAVNYTAYIP